MRSRLPAPRGDPHLVRPFHELIEPPGFLRHTPLTNESAKSGINFTRGERPAHGVRICHPSGTFDRPTLPQVGSPNVRIGTGEWPNTGVGGTTDTVCALTCLHPAPNAPAAHST